MDKKIHKVTGKAAVSFDGVTLGETSEVTYATTAANSSASNFTMDDIREAMREGEKIAHDILRAESGLIEATLCKTCGRRGTVCNDGMGRILLVCPHIHAAILRLTRTYTTSPPHSLAGIRIGVLDDGPRRW